MLPFADVLNQLTRNAYVRGAANYFDAVTAQPAPFRGSLGH
jgi:hypothetical protein